MDPPQGVVMVAMRESLFSPSWYRVQTLRPRIRSHVEIHRHDYRGEPWYVMQDHASGRFQRFTPAAHFLIGLMDGERTVEEIWKAGRSRYGEDAPTQEEMIRLLSQLHAVDALQSDVPPDTLELLRRFEKRPTAKWKQNIRNPLAMRFSLFDPERVLVWGAPFVRPLFGWLGALVWLVVVAIGVILAGLHWPELTENVTDQVLAPKNLILLWFIFPALKAIHEFGHAFTIKLFGGEVHEMGIMFLVLTPIPYVDASSAIAFRSKWERILVGAVGIGVELFVAALALIVWVNVEPGGVRAVLYNVIIIGGVSSLLFNGNPLLRYDGYYVLSDLLEIPNLGSRGTQYLGYLVQHYLFGVRDAEPPVSTTGERVWFILYTVSSFAYRIIIYIAIIQFIASKFLAAGLLLALWAAVSMLVLPLVKSAKFLFSSPRLGRKRTRAVTVTAVALAIVVAIVTLVPVPLSTVAEGVLWFPEESFVRARTDGFVERLVTAPGTQVKPGDLLVECSDPLLPARIKILDAQLRELQVQYNMNERTDRVQAQVALDEIEQVKQQLDHARARLDELKIYSRAQGIFFVPTAQDLPGRFFKRGQEVGYVLSKSAMAARTVVHQSDVDLVRNRTRGVKLRLPERITETLPSALVREIPAGTDQLPARVLSQLGGGEVAIDPRDQKGVKAFQRVFMFDIELPPQVYHFNVGGRVYVRFYHGLEPLAWRWYREVRQLLLKRFNV
jgi:putative peptide zinc metalloprotease protein